MGKPTKEELALALAQAKFIREHGIDEHFMAKSLLNHHYRLTSLEQVMHVAERYLRSGQGEREHALLVRAIEQARRAEEYGIDATHEDLGLG